MAGPILWAGRAWAALRILCTTFSLQEITLNVAHGREGIHVERLLPASLGCPHGYAMTPEERRKIESADILVINGLGLEAFLNPLLRQEDLRRKIIDASAGIEKLLADEMDHEEPVQASPTGRSPTPTLNPHLTVSPLMRGEMARNIAGGLSRADPEGTPLYERNAAAYATRMFELAQEMAQQVRALRTTRVMISRGLFDYLARDIGLEVAGTLPTHEEHSSAAQMIEARTLLREQRIGAMLLESRSTSRVGQILARETGVPIVIFDPATAGPEAVPLDYYERTMRKNMEALRAILGLADAPEPASRE